MPWRLHSPMFQRLAFVEDAQRGLYAMTELCARYGISRRVGYKWLARYEAEGPDGLVDRPRVATTHPHRTADDIAAQVLDCRNAHPSWGPRKLLAYLGRRHPHEVWPAASTVGALLKREGLVRARRRRTPPGHPGRPTTPMEAPNTVWTTDFKGQFRTGDHVYCYPLTVLDGYSRFLLACRGLHSTGTDGARGVFERLFRDYGLPERIRSDNGVPFATTGLARLSTLSVWWIKLGITPELIQPSAPQQNGAHERMHKTLKAEATKPPRANVRAQQRRFDAFRQEYNTERPHEALGNVTPASCYVPSPRPYPARLVAPEYPGHYEVRRVGGNGGVWWRHEWVNVSHVLLGESIGLEEIADGIWSVYFGPKLLGRFDERDRRIRGAHNRNIVPPSSP